MDDAEVVRQAYAAWNRRDVDGWLSWWHEDAEWRPVLALDECYRGHAELRRFAEEVFETLGGTGVDVEEVRDQGGLVVVSGRLRARGSASGLALERAHAWVFELRGGKIAGARSFAEKADALAAVERGLGRARPPGDGSR